MTDVVRIVERLGVGPVRDLGLLDSAVHRPQSSAFGEDAYPNLPMKAAALLHSLSGHHALVDGNKRLAWAATRVFLLIDDNDAHLSEDEAFDLVLAVAHGDLDVPAIAEQMRVRPAT